MDESLKCSVIVLLLMQYLVINAGSPIHARNQLQKQPADDHIQHVAHRRLERGAVADKARLWPDGIVYYSISDGFTASHRETIFEAMRHWENKTCLRFRERCSNQPGVIFIYSLWCSSVVGRLKGRIQPITMSSACFTLHTVLHELGHAIGFYHEHQRPDRDKYITVHKDNIIPGMYNRGFATEKPTDVDSLGLEYDFESIMHYSPKAFSKDGSTTLEAKGNNTINTFRSDLSPLDILQANLLYKDECIKREDSVIPTSDNSCNYCCDQPAVSPHKCNIYINQTQGQFEAPPYPYTTCTWVIEVPKGYEVLVKLRQISDFAGESCVTVQNSPNSSSEVSRCNTNGWSTIDVYTATRFAYVKYWTINSRLIREPYFSLTYEAVVKLEITDHPVGGVIPDGRALTLKCKASSSGRPVYSWEKGDFSGHWTTVSGSNSSSYTTKTSGQYRCKVSSGNETITSNTTYVNVYGPPKIVTDPINHSATPDASITLNCQGNGIGSIAYEWETRSVYGSEWKPAGVHDRLVIRRPKVSHQFRCVVSNEAGKTVSKISTISVLKITTQPHDTQATVGSMAILTCGSSVSSGVGFFWIHNGNIFTGQITSTGGNSTLTIASVKKHDAGRYVCYLISGRLSIASTRAILTVI